LVPPPNGNNFKKQSNDNDSDLKIADFGFAKKCPSTGLTTMCGTPGYVAPEILERIPYDTQCDLWSLGVIVYILLGGYSPFEEKSQDALFARIRAGDYTFHEEFWHTVSANGKDLIRSLLTVDPSKRLTAEAALQHSWMTVSEDVLASTDLGVNLHELKRFNAKRKFKAAVKTVIATQKLTLMFQQVF
jgi:calcium/calmodulin-dependent protein kinase I